MNLKWEDFNFKRVRFGFGRIQRRILGDLEDTQRDMLGLKVLTCQIYHSESGQLCDGCDGPYVYTKSQYNSVSRAIKSLERSKLLRTDIIPVQENGRQVNVKVVGFPKTKKEST